MAVSILVRLLSSPHSARRVAGEVEVIATGERALFRDADELLAILAAQSDEKPGINRVDIDPPASGVSDA